MTSNAVHRHPRTAPTVNDIARECGVAASTVSRALSRRDRVSVATAERIKAAAERIGYRVGPVAGERESRPSAILAMVVSDITDPVYLPVIRGAEKAVTSAGFTMILADFQESADNERPSIERVSAMVEGVALASSHMSADVARAIAERTPLVAVNRVITGVPSLITDDARGMCRAVEHLGELGHTSVTYLAGPEDSWADGVQWRAIEEAGYQLEINTDRIGPYRPTVEGGLLAAAELRRNLPTAVIAYNDQLAVGALRSLLAAGVRIPAELSIIGFGNTLSSDVCTPALTTVAPPLHALGAAAAAHLMARIRDAPTRPDQLWILPDRLILRDSTDSPPAARGLRRLHVAPGEVGRQRADIGHDQRAGSGLRKNGRGEVVGVTHRRVGVTGPAGSSASRNDRRAGPASNGRPGPRNGGYDGAATSGNTLSGQMVMRTISA
jgi:DNA-binding LacI/PurR family transcriptional regulator